MSRRHAAPDPTDVPSRPPVVGFAYRAFRDLCSTCNHAEACGDRSTPERPILFCENFEAFLPPVSVGAAAPHAGRMAADAAAGEVKGLCANCENHGTCALPRPAGGVWHCEEYR